MTVATVIFRPGRRRRNYGTLDSVLAAFGEIGEGYAKASRFAEAHSELVLAERPRVGQTQVRETDSMTLDRPPVASLIRSALHQD